MAEPTDAALAASAAGGDTGAFEMLMRRHYAAVWRIAFLSAREEMAAEELAQDTFLRAYGALSGWRGDASLRTWLATICRRLCIDRARLKHPETVTEPDLESAAGSTSETEALADRVDLRAALDRLPADDREAFLLVHHYGYSSFETAALLGVPASTVRSRAESPRGKGISRPNMILMGRIRACTRGNRRPACFVLSGRKQSRGRRKPPSTRPRCCCQT